MIFFIEKPRSFEIYFPNTLFNFVYHLVMYKKTLELVDQGGKKFSHGSWKLEPKEKGMPKVQKENLVVERHVSAGPLKYPRLLVLHPLPKRRLTNTESIPDSILKKMIFKLCFLFQR